MLSTLPYRTARRLYVSDRFVIKKTSGTLPFSCEQVFDIAADIERYPEFLRGWVSARIQKRESDTCYVDQVVGLGPIRLQFTSKAVLYRPERIEVTSTQAPFRQFTLSWLVAAVPPAGCRVSVAAEVELQSGIMQHLANQILPAAVDDIITAFEARAHRLCAPAAG
jgi:coenzyme Q-binding protein COQ10